MTGRELILFILQNDFENEDVTKIVETLNESMHAGLMTATEAATKFNVGIETIRLWYETGALEGIRFKDSVYFKKNAKLNIKD